MLKRAAAYQRPATMVGCCKFDQSVTTHLQSVLVLVMLLLQYCVFMPFQYKFLFRLLELYYFWVYASYQGIYVYAYLYRAYRIIIENFS